MSDLTREFERRTAPYRSYKRLLEKKWGNRFTTKRVKQTQHLQEKIEAIRFDLFFSKNAMTFA